MSDAYPRNIENEIVELLKEKEPLSLNQLAEELNTSQHACIYFLRKLVDEEKVIKLPVPNSGRIYYILNKKATWNDISNMHMEVAKETVKAKDDYEDLKDKMDKINDNVNGIYANMISIISIIVAIFALITVNANIAFELSQENVCDVFRGIIAVNIFVVVCIIVLLIGIRLILINPMLGKKKKEKKDKKSERG